MKEKYKLIPQEPLCCVPCALEMVYDRHNVNMGMGQKELAISLDVAIPSKHSKLFPNAKITDIEKDIGCHVNDLNFQLFNKLNHPFEEIFIHINNIPEWYLKEKIIESFESDMDILAGINFSTLTNRERNNINHLIIIEDVYGEHVQVIIPETEESYRRIFAIETLYDSLRVSNDGLWLIKYNK